MKLMMTAILAHAGPHEPTTEGLLHALTEPDHLLAGSAFLVALTAVWVYRRVRSCPEARRAPRES